MNILNLLVVTQDLVKKTGFSDEDSKAEQVEIMNELGQLYKLWLGYLLTQENDLPQEIQNEKNYLMSFYFKSMYKENTKELENYIVNLCDEVTNSIQKFYDIQRG